MPDDQEPVLNKEAALELCYDNEGLFLKIVQAYLEGAMEHSKHLLYALEADDTHQMEERAHALKGSSSKICADPVREAAQLLERVRRSEDLSGTATL